MSRDFAPAFQELRRSFDADPVARYFCVTLLTANLALILLHIGIGGAYQLGWRHDPLPDLWNISRDRSVPEFLNYLQSGLCAVLVLLCWLRVRLHARLAWALVFAFIVVDDALEYHEIVGGYLVGVLQVPGIAGLQASEIGELLAWLIAAAVIAVPMIAALRQKQSRTDPLSNLLLVSFLSLVFFAVGMDALHDATGGKDLISRTIGALEDGGEMLSLAFACSCAFAFFRRRA